MIENLNLKGIGIEFVKDKTVLRLRVGRDKWNSWEAVNILYGSIPRRESKKWNSSNCMMMANIGSICLFHKTPDKVFPWGQITYLDRKLRR
jgi:hypothetical protein